MQIGARSSGSSDGAVIHHRSAIRRKAKTLGNSKRMSDKVMLQRTDRRAKAREKQRRCRARRRAGETLYRVAVPEVSLIEALIASGRVGRAESADYSLVQKAVEGVVRDFIERWLPGD
jgi:hypothetical protein